MCYREGCGIVPTDESTSIRNCGDAYDGIRPGRMIAKFRGWPCRVADHRNLWHIREALPVMISFVARWRGTAELTPLRSVRPSYRFLRPRSRENLSPAGTSHFPRPWVGHVRRTAPPDRRHGDEDIHHWKTV